MSTVVDEMVIKWSIDDTNYTQGLNSIDKKMKLVKSEFGATDSKLQAFGSTIDKLKNKQEYLTKTLNLQEQKCKSLKEAYEKTKKETGENSEASQKLATRLNNAVKYYNKLENELKQTSNKLEEEEKKLKKSSSAWGKLSEAAEQANKKISNSVDKIKGFATKIGGAFVATTGISANFANDFEQSMGKLQASVGASSEKMESFKDVVKDVYADNFGENFGDVADSVQLVNKYLDLTGDDLKNITELSLGFRDAFGVDTNESIRSCKALMDNFGVSAEEAFNLLVQGEQQGLDYSGELIDNVNEYSVQFGKLGLSAEDMFNIFESGTNAGAFNLDKIGDAVKEFSIRAIDGSNTTIDGFTKLGLSSDEMASKFASGGDSAKNAFYQVIEGIRNIKDPVEQSIVGVDLFGTMWEDLGPQVVTSLDSVKNGFDKTKSSADDLNNVQYNNLGDGLKGLWREIQVSCLTPLESELMPKFNDVFQKIRDKMPQIKDVISNAMSKLADTVGFIVDNLDTIIPVAKGALVAFLGFKTISGVNSAFKTVNESITNLKNGWDIIKNINVGKAINNVKKALSGLSGVLKIIMAHPVIAGITIAIGVIALLYTKCEWFRNGVKAIGEAIKNIFNVVCEFIKKAWTVMCEALKTVINAFIVVFKITIEVIKTVFEVVCGFIKQIWEGLWTAIKAILTPVIEYIKFRWELLKTVFSILVEGIKIIWDALCNFLKDILTPVIEGIKNMWQSFKDKFSEVSDAASSKWNSFTEGIKSIWNGAVEFIKGIWNGITSVFQSVVSSATGIWNGLCNGIQSAFSLVVDNIKNAFKSIISPFQSVADSIANIWSSIKSKIKLPHFNVTGEFSLNPPSVPHIGIDWCWKGAIFKSPTVLGGIGVGDRYKGMGSNAEAIIPLDSMYANLRSIVQEEQQKLQDNIIYNTTIVTLDGEVISEKTEKRVVKGVDKKQRSREFAKGGF